MKPRAPSFDINRRHVLLAAAATVAMLFCAAVPMFKQAAAQAQERKPNVVFILADNVGYGDLGSYGGGELRGAPTPRLDELARDGL
ncbi:MAG: arylsulfatase, partial [Xanthobacteraceae bacterium]